MFSKREIVSKGLYSCYSIHYHLFVLWLIWVWTMLTQSTSCASTSCSNVFVPSAVSDVQRVNWVSCKSIAKEKRTRYSISLYMSAGHKDTASDFHFYFLFFLGRIESRMQYHYYLDFHALSSHRNSDSWY